MQHLLGAQGHAAGPDGVIVEVAGDEQHAGPPARPLPRRRLRRRPVVPDQDERRSLPLVGRHPGAVQHLGPRTCRGAQAQQVVQKVLVLRENQNGFGHGHPPSHCAFGPSPNASTATPFTVPPLAAFRGPQRKSVDNHALVENSITPNCTKLTNAYSAVTWGYIQSRAGVGWLPGLAPPGRVAALRPEGRVVPPDMRRPPPGGRAGVVFLGRLGGGGVGPG